jgi:hypothetical protein
MMDNFLQGILNDVAALAEGAAKARADRDKMRDAYVAEQHRSFGLESELADAVAYAPR